MKDSDIIKTIGQLEASLIGTVAAHNILSSTGGPEPCAASALAEVMNQWTARDAPAAMPVNRREAWLQLARVAIVGATAAHAEARDGEGTTTHGSD